MVKTFFNFKLENILFIVSWTGHRLIGVWNMFLHRNLKVSVYFTSALDLAGQDMRARGQHQRQDHREEASFSGNFGSDHRHSVVDLV